jgi:membrane protein required for colicin V production
MNTVDYILVVLVSVSGVVGVLRGFIREALSVLVWILALWGSARYGGQLGPLLDGCNPVCRQPAWLVGGLSDS